MAWFLLFSGATTVSSLVVMVSIARGNLPAAIFNASISSIIGIFVTPLWMGLMISTASNQFGLWPIILKLILQVLAPVALGILLNRKFGWISGRDGNTLRLFDQAVILLIIYTSFCESFANNMFGGFSLWGITLPGLLMVALFFCHFWNNHHNVSAVKI